MVSSPAWAANRAQQVPTTCPMSDGEYMAILPRTRSQPPPTPGFPISLGLHFPSVECEHQNVQPSSLTILGLWYETAFPKGTRER